ncbi:hypothetical protein BCD49_35800 [Pseudofrankia sp. EUN1h]|nr:hypothetical protein BCD49_35800 [Pseudofrankia sp. EUN1h]
MVPRGTPLATPIVAFPPRTARPGRTVTTAIVTRRARTVTSIGLPGRLPEAARAVPRPVRAGGPAPRRPVGGTLGATVTAATGRSAPTGAGAGRTAAERPATGRVVPTPAVGLPTTGGRSRVAGPRTPAGTTPLTGRASTSRPAASAEPVCATRVVAAAETVSAAGVVAPTEAAATAGVGPVAATAAAWV